MAELRNDIPGWEGSQGPFPGDYARLHVYARDIHSGAGNCVCGADLGNTRHVMAAPGVPGPRRPPRIGGPVGFRYKPREYAITITGGDLAGFEAVMGDTTIDEMLAFQHAAADPELASGAVVDIVSRHLIAWNLEDDLGNPVPALGMFVQTLPVALLGVLITAWFVKMGEDAAALTKTITTPPGGPPDA